MRTTLDLPDPLFCELKAQAARQHVKMKDLLKTYVEAGIYGHSPSASQSRPAHSPLPVARRASGKTIRALSNKQIQQLLDEDDASRSR